MSTSCRDFILDVIEKYKFHKCLWQIRHEDYRDKMKRNRALDDIVRLFRTKDQTANRETVQKKLQTIRGSYKKELRKVKESQNTGSCQLHVPKLWYFNHLSFLEEKDILIKTNTTSSMLDDIPFDEVEHIDSNEDISCPVNSHSPLPTPTFKQRQKEEEILEKISKHLDAPAPSHFEKPHDAFGKYIAEKLRSIPMSMVPYCQKIINEAIFLAEIESLNLTSRIMTDQETVSSPPTPWINRSYTVMEDNYNVIKQDNTDDFINNN